MQTEKEYSSQTIKIFPATEKHDCIAQIQLTAVAIQLYMYICFMYILHATGSTDSYLWMREGKEEPEAFNIYKSMQKHTVNETLLRLILILFLFAMVLDQYRNCNPPN